MTKARIAPLRWSQAALSSRAHLMIRIIGCNDFSHDKQAPEHFIRRDKYFDWTAFVLPVCVIFHT
jgi:hypothetical protein